MTKGRNILVALLVAASCACLVVACIFLADCTSKCDGDTRIAIYPQDTPVTVVGKLKQEGIRTCGFSLLAKVLRYDNARPGLYRIAKGSNILSVFRMLRNGRQEPVNLTIPSVRTMDRLAGFLGDHLMMDSTDIVNAFSDSLFCDSLGYSVATLPALFIPNTYQVYWTTSLGDFVKRMQRENAAFWNDQREAKAKALGMTHEEVVTLASIIDEETANNGEKPMIAGMYINRLHTGMPLQADPTIKFALQDFTLRRIWGKHLNVDSPYNTYKNIGLPPGPIRIPSIAGIDAVLDAKKHDYLYMCAKEDFSGTHNFARTYGEHLQNARKYTQALNNRGIK